MVNRSHSSDSLTAEPYTHEVEVEGHLIDSMILSRIWDRIMDLGGDFEVLEFRVGRLKTDYSYARMMVKGRDQAHLNLILEEIYRLGAVSSVVYEARCEPAPRDGVAPDGFYSTTHNPTFVYYGGRWIEVEDMMMDKAIVVDAVRGRAFCRPLLEIKRGDLVVIGEVGVKIKPPERPRENIGVFEFMGSSASSEKPAASIIKRIAEDIRNIKGAGGRIVVVAGPAIIHTGATDAFAKMIRDGYVDAVLAGNALAVHDAEAALYGTSLGIKLSDGIRSGHRNHMAAINEIFKAGSLEAAVGKGVLKKGVIYECVKRGVPLVLAGSIRDDGPLPDAITDVVVAQRMYKEALKGADMVIMLSTMLHSIAVGNMLPSSVKIVCVDINLATVTKLLDRGTTQAVGVVSDVGTFLPLLVDELEKRKSL